MQLHKRFGPIVNGFGSETPIYHRRDLVCILRKPGESQNVTYVHTSLSRVFVLRRNILFSLSAPVYLSLNWPVKGAICPWFYEN